ncbi:hypothetical protein PR048_018813 [Dryococelus australis]|uniref:Uncharacterized protein n=1 Tax=Dryococelus australis TaxID=614101 RepID=A0ABQ9H1R1_9NEOP|nr:hypothetical protein PR048_018813 [Dryococelus australis]
MRKLITSQVLGRLVGRQIATLYCDVAAAIQGRPRSLLWDSKENFDSEGGHGSVVVSLLATHLGEPGSIPGGVAPGFPHVGIVPDDAADRRVFSGISRFPSPLNSGVLHTHLVSQDLDVESHTDESTPLSTLTVLRADEGEARLGAAPVCRGKGVGDSRERLITTANSGRGFGAGADCSVKQAVKRARCLAELRTAAAVPRPAPSPSFTAAR